MGELIKRLRHEKWRLKSELRNCIYYLYARKKKNASEINGSDIKVCFILQRTEIFTSVQSIFEAMCADNRFSVSVLVLPRYNHAKKEVNIDTIQKNLEFCQSLNSKAVIINPYDAEQKSFQGISHYDFDYIFLGLPYINEYPEEYRFKNLPKSCRLCYVPYGSSYADGREMLRVSLTNDLLVNVDYLFADCDKVYRYCNSKLKLCKNADSKKIVYNIGFPRYDLVEREKKHDGVKTFLWLPRWTTSTDNNEKSTFFENKDVLIKYFQDHPELLLIIRPHPLMFAHYIDTGVMTKAEVADYKQLINDAPNITLDESASYLDSFRKADCLIADYSSVVIEYFITGQPIIYLNGTDTVEKEVAEAFYVSESPDQTISYMKKLVSGMDEKADLRKCALSGNSYHGGVNKRVINTLLSED